MSAPKTIFFTYVLATSPITGGTYPHTYQSQANFGYATPIHCNYIERLETPSLANKNIDVILPDASSFPFLRNSIEIQAGYDGWGWNARYLYGLCQIVNGTGSTITADPANWSVIDLTPQLDGYASFSGTTIPVTAFNSSTIMVITITSVINAPKYDLSYLHHPMKLSVDNDKLTFGEEAFFFGNVNTEIQAIAYTTEIPAVLPLNQYNSSTNLTWDQSLPVTISEMGIFNANNDLVGIAKLNNPIDKDSTIYRTILFSIDF